VGIGFTRHHECYEYVQRYFLPQHYGSNIQRWTIFIQRSLLPSLCLDNIGLLRALHQHSSTIALDTESPVGHDDLLPFYYRSTHKYDSVPCTYLRIVQLVLYVQIGTVPHVTHTQNILDPTLDYRSMTPIHYASSMFHDRICLKVSIIDSYQ
jgi:hypothetical protein